eukprot:15472246-Alexandrium_andersonii.AAC.1
MSTFGLKRLRARVLLQACPRDLHVRLHAPSAVHAWSVLPAFTGALAHVRRRADIRPCAAVQVTA